MAGGDDTKRQRWLCSYSYNDPIYSLHVCPFKRSSCGPNSEINFYDVGDDGAIHIKDLKEGDTCTYKIESVCGAPSFTIGNSTGTYRAYFTEYQQD